MGEKPVDIKAIFADALEKETAAERAAYLDKACGNDANLRNKVEALLRAYEQASDVPEAPIIGPEITLDDCPLTEGPGTKIGRYKLLELIGEGGFGVVYMAEQEKPIRRRVALKIIKLGMDTKQVIARFEAERQALAMMEHPNIAKVLDAGATDTGRPYFVMELVKGIPVTEYCDKNNLDTRQRLELFIEVCKAVQHAHQKGIIHRDIKPTNVMITLRDNGTGVPKIIDFGIAKATQARLTEKTLFTEFKQFIGTPEYMSPEQAQMGEVDVDTRSDIYSLGVLLYELLTGTTPFDGEKLRSSAYDEMLRTIRETEPPKPSTRLNTLGDALTDVAKHRHVEPSELCKLLRGDLDWVVTKTLEKERTRRYDTANELAMDIERHLKDEPVVAGPPGTVYRVRKFVRRHRTGVLFCITVAAALMIGLSLAVVGFVRASRARARAEDQRERAEASLKLAREAVDEMTRAADQQLSGAPAGHEAGRQLLQKAELLYGRFLEKRRDEPAAREQSGLAYKRLGRIHYALGNYEQSEQAYRQSVNVFETLAEDFPEDGRHELNIVNTMDNRADPLEALGRGKEADEIMPARREKVKGLVRRFPHNSLYRKMLVDECKDQGSRQSYEEAIGWFEGLLADHPSCRYELATLLMYFGTFLKGAGQLEEARQAEHKAEAIRQGLVALLPRQPCETRRLHMPWPHGGWLCLADYKVRITQVGEYQLYVRSAGHDNNSRSFYAWIEELGDGPGGTVADWYVYYTPDAYARVGKHWDEEADFERVDERVRDRGNGVWQIAAPGDYTITFAPREDGVAIDAFVFQLASLPAPEADGPPESERTEEMVFLERDGRAVAEAEHFADRTPFECSWLVVPGEDAGDTAHINFRGAGYVQALPDRSPSEGQWQLLTNKADAESDLGLWDKAIADYSEALAIMPAHLPALTGRGEAYAESGQWDKAIADYSKAIELDPSNPWAWHGRGAVYQQKKQWDKAIADCSKAIELNPDDSGHWQRRANVYSNMKQWDKAIADYSKAIELGDEWGPWEERFDAYLQLGEVEKGLADFSKAIELDPDNSDHWHRRADAYSNMGKWDKALADYSRAIEVDPSNSWAWSGRGEVYGQKRQWDKAFADYSRAIEVGPSNPWAWHGRSCVYQHKKQWDKAIADCSKAIELDPDYSHHWHRRADVYFEMKQWDQALADLCKAVELNPKHSHHWHRRADVYCEMEQWDQALADLSKAIELNPNHSGHWQRRADTYSNMKQWDKAIADYSKAIELGYEWDSWQGRFNVYLQLGQPEKGLAEYAEALSVDPNNPRLWHARGDAYSNMQQWDKALADFSKAIELDPSNPWAWHGRGGVYQQKKQWDKALADSSKAIEIEVNRDDTSHHWRRRADVYCEMKQWDQALADYSKAIELNPNHSGHWHRRADAYSNMRQWDKALADFSKAIELNPNHSGHWSRRANTYSNMRKWDKAIADYSRAIEVDPNNPWAWSGRGEVYRQKRQWDKALADCSKAIETEVDPDNSSHQWHRRANVHSAMQQWEKAFADYSKAIEVDPSNPHAWHGRSRVYQQEKQWDKALADCSKAVELDPDHSHHWHRRADIYWEMQRWDQALADLSKAVELNPNHSAHWHRRADVYSNMKQWDKAIADFSKAIELNQSNPDHWRRRADVYTNMKQWEKAVADYSKAIELRPDAWWIWKRRFKAYVQLGQQDKGLADYSKLIKLKPRNAKVRVSRGDCYYSHLKDYPKAVEDYSAAIELDPNFTEAWYSRGRAHGALGQFDKAAQDFAKAVELGWNGAYNRYCRALAELGSGNTKRYRQTCAGVLKQFGQTEEPEIGHWVAWTCVLAPNAVEDLGQAVNLAEQRAGRDDKNDQYLNTLGAILYRAGRFDEAARQLSALTSTWEQSRELPTDTSPGYTWFFLAMAHHQLGHADEAKSWFDKAVERAEQEMQSEPAWNRRLTLRLLRKESESLIRPEEVVPEETDDGGQKTVRNSEYRMKK